MRGTVLSACFFILCYCGDNERRWLRFPNFLPAPVFSETRICISTTFLYHLSILSSPRSSHYHHPPSPLFGCVNVWVCYVCKMKTPLRLFKSSDLSPRPMCLHYIIWKDRPPSLTRNVKYRVIYTYMLVYIYWWKTFRSQRITKNEKRIVFEETLCLGCSIVRVSIISYVILKSF